MLLLVALAAFISVQAASINHDEVQPFAQPEPITESEKAAVKFKPSLYVLRGCHPYPAVNAAGDTSAGLKGTGKPEGECEGSSLGSQVYSRSTWHLDKWAIMYAWYFPKDVPKGLFHPKGLRHDWVNVVVWLDNPAIAKPNVLATSVMEAGGGYNIHKPLARSDIIDGVTPKMQYNWDADKWYHILTMSPEKGEFQDLIQWDQLTDAAREALNNTDFGGHANVPFSDPYFQQNIEAAATYYVYLGRYRGYETKSIWE